MRNRLLLTALLFTIIAVPVRAAACGVERWDAKVLADGSALSGPYASTVANLLTIAAPYESPFASRTAPERYIYRVQAELLGFKLEQDGDIHLIIAQPGDRTQTMIAEIPDPKCMRGAPAQYVNDVAQTRLNFVRTYGIPPFREFRLVYQPITVTGPLLFDFEHGQRGAATNDVEIHPVIAIGETSVTPAAAVPPLRQTTSTNTNSSNAECPGDTKVWVNLNSGIYHLPGTRWYGTTRRGMYMCRRAADAAGYRAARNE